MITAGMTVGAIAVGPALTGLQSRELPEILVAMTRISVSGRWPLQDAKARFSELVRRVKSEGPQRVTVYGREVAVVVSIEEFRRLQGRPTGQALVDVLKASRSPDFAFDRRRMRAPVRKVDL